MTEYFSIMFRADIHIMANHKCYRLSNVSGDFECESKEEFRAKLHAMVDALLDTTQAGETKL